MLSQLGNRSYILARDRVAVSPLQIVVVAAIDGFRRAGALG